MSKKRKIQLVTTEGVHIPLDIISIILQFEDNPKEYVRLARVSKDWEIAVYRPENIRRVNWIIREDPLDPRYRIPDKIREHGEKFTIAIGDDMKSALLWCEHLKSFFKMRELTIKKWVLFAEQEWIQLIRPH